MEKTLHVNGRELTSTEFVQVPTEGKWFKVNPLAIDQNLFKEIRSDQNQEEIRLLILEAFEEMKKDSKYAKPFKTMFPQKTWEVKSVKDLREMAKNLGDHNADWIEQSLEWAQRLQNGETWEDICNKIDTVFNCRLIEWSYGYCKYIGGFNEHPATYIDKARYYQNDNSLWAIPLIVSYED